MNIALIGGGNMARALIGGLVAHGHAPETLTVVEIDAEARTALAARFGVATFGAIEEPAVGDADVVVIAVKPYHVRTVAGDLGGLLESQVVLSIAAGIRLVDLCRWLGGYRRLVRAMPNTPALIGAGIAGLFALPGVDGDGRRRAAAVLEAVGATLWCEREEDLDAVTGVSGSGPAYVFYFVEALEAAARELGFEPAQARRLAVATFSGAMRLVEQSESEPAILRAQVTSKGGTTERGIAALEEARVKDAIRTAVKAATARAQEMGAIYGGES